MNILAVDTCLEPGSIALLSENSSRLGTSNATRDPEIVALPPNWRSVSLHEQIRQLLVRNSLSTANIDLYAVTAGPGAFTGVRLGLTAVKGLAEVHDKPIIPISTLQVLAFGVGSRNFQEATVGKNLPATAPAYAYIAPAFDARRGQVFAAVYHFSQNEGAGLQPVIPDSVCSLRAFLTQIQSGGLPAERLCFAVTDEALLLPAIEEFGWTAGSLIGISPRIAGTAARMALERFRQGKGSGALAAAANYVRASDAELFWKD